MSVHLVLALLVGGVLGCGPTEPAGTPALPEGFSATTPAPGTAITAEGHYRVSLALASGADAPPLGSLHAWEVSLETADGVVFSPKRLAFDGGMPHHDHGFDTAPRVTGAVAPGRWRIEGVRFQMGGLWRVRVEVVGPSGPDVALFRVRVPGAAAVEGALGAAEQALLRSLSLASLPAPAPDPSNRVADDERAARLGQRLFFEPRLSASGEISCATCHRPDRYFTDGRATSVGLGPGPRNAPTVVGAGHSPWLFADGRRDSLWAQALAPLETAHEMGLTRVEVVRQMAADPAIRAAYEAVFGEALPGLDEEGPARAGPFGDPKAAAAWKALGDEEQRRWNRAFANAGKAIAAYERRLQPGPTRFDAYAARLLEGDPAGAAEILDADEVAGLRLFLDGERTRCLRCHNGPLFTNQGFHHVASARLGGVPDLGRFVGLQAVLLDPFNCLGAYSDAPAPACRALRFLERRESAHLAGAFKTPTLRGVAATAPYFHDGSLPDLEAVLAHYRRPPADPSSELEPLDLTDRESDQLAAFLRTFSAEVAAEASWLGPPP